MAGQEPRYQQLTAKLRAAVATLPVGAALPSERALSEEHGVARMTARKALEALENEGLVVREVGRGTFVSRPGVSLPLRLTSFSEDVRVRGMVPTSTVLRFERSAATDTQVEKLATQEVVELHRVRLADGQPLAIERSTLVGELVPGIERFDLAQESLYAVLEREYGLWFDGGEQTIRAALADEEVARLLGLTKGSPVLELERTSSAGGRVVEHTISTYAGERFELSAHIEPVRSRGSAD